MRKWIQAGDVERVPDPRRQRANQQGNQLPTVQVQRTEERLNEQQCTEQKQQVGVHQIDPEPRTVSQIQYQERTAGILADVAPDQAVGVVGPDQQQRDKGYNG